KDAGLLIGQKDIVHAVNVHERCGTEIEFLKKKQWQIKVLDKKEELIEIAQKARWFPEYMKIRYEHWVKNLQWNWGISRQRYYGVPFPAWFCKDCGATLLADEKNLPVDPREKRYGKKCDCGSANIEPEMDVMDTWMTSSCTPQINQDWGGNERKGFMPMSMRPQGHDIIRTWAFYTIVKAYYHNNDIPWKDVMISGHGQDPHGQKMSKSKGNFVIAQDVIKKYSADAFRFWAASVKLGDDLPYQEKDVLTGQKMVTKLWNASKFSIMHLEDFKSKPKDLEMMDRWILSKLHKIIKDCTATFEEYEYSKTKQEVEKFFWGTLCDNYLEICKDRLYNPESRGKKARQSAQFALYESVLSILKLIAPIMPHITEAVYQLYFTEKEMKKSIHISDWPEYDPALIDEEAEKAGDLAVDIIAAVRKFKSENSVSLKKELKVLKIGADGEQKALLENVIDDIKATTRALEVSFAKGEIETEKFGIAISVKLAE
ncbi:MAG: class I tRNA ligase family protein, partial [Candidatus Nanoarchaeia archaeon]